MVSQCYNVDLFIFFNPAISRSVWWRVTCGILFFLPWQRPTPAFGVEATTAAGRPWRPTLAAHVALRAASSRALCPGERREEAAQTGFAGRRLRRPGLWRWGRGQQKGTAPLGAPHHTRQNYDPPVSTFLTVSSTKLTLPLNHFSPMLFYLSVHSTRNSGLSLPFFPFSLFFFPSLSWINRCESLILSIENYLSEIIKTTLFFSCHYVARKERMAPFPHWLETRWPRHTGQTAGRGQMQQVKSVPGPPTSHCHRGRLAPCEMLIGERATGEDLARKSSNGSLIIRIGQVAPGNSWRIKSRVWKTT